jgi:hypothetical protein
MFILTKVDWGFPKDKYYCGDGVNYIIPHIIYDDNFEVVIFPSYKAGQERDGLIISFLSEFIWLYEQKQDIIKNLAKLIVWLYSQYKPDCDILINQLNEKYPQYKNNIEKYLVLL